MFLIFAPGKYLTLIFLFLDIFFSISSDIIESPKTSGEPFLPSSRFCCRELLSALLIFYVGINWSFLVFELRGDFYLEGLSITTSKSTPNGLLEKPSTALLLIDVSSSQIIGEDFFILLNLVSVESSLNGVMLIGNLFSMLVQLSHHLYVIIIWCFNGSNKIILRCSCFKIVY